MSFFLSLHMYHFTWNQFLWALIYFKYNLIHFIDVTNKLDIYFVAISMQVGLRHQLMYMNRLIYDDRYIQIVIARHEQARDRKRMK